MLITNGGPGKVPKRRHLRLRYCLKRPRASEGRARVEESCFGRKWFRSCAENEDMAKKW